MRYTVFAVALVALSVAACGSSTTGAPTAPAPASSPEKATHHVAGLISSMSGNSVQVAQQNGSATVDFTSSTKIWSVTGGQLTDVTAGACVTVRPARHSNPGGGTVTAAAVLTVPASNGQCPTPRGGREVAGAVGTVNGDTFTIAASGSAAQISVSVTDKTRYAKRVPADAAAIGQGKCLSATGTKDSRGALQAALITVRPAENGSCPAPRR